MEALKGVFQVTLIERPAFKMKSGVYNPGRVRILAVPTALLQFCDLILLQKAQHREIDLRWMKPNKLKTADTPQVIVDKYMAEDQPTSETTVEINSWRE